MDFLRALLRLIALELILSLPGLGLGFLIAGIPGILLVFLLFYLIILVIGFSAEPIVARAHRALDETPPGLQKSLARVLEQAGIPASRSPRLLVFPDPAPNAMVARSLGSNGLILVSQGLVGRTSEEELRSVILHCLGSCHSTGTAVTTICAILASTALRLAPRNWVEAVLESGTRSAPGTRRELGPLSAAGFLLVFPLARLLVRLGGRIRWETGEPAIHLQTALLKIRASLSSWDLSWNPGFNSLYLVDFHGSRAVLPINSPR